MMYRDRAIAKAKEMKATFGEPIDLNTPQGRADAIRQLGAAETMVEQLLFALEETVKDLESQREITGIWQNGHTGLARPERRELASDKIVAAIVDRKAEGAVEEYAKALAEAVAKHGHFPGCECHCEDDCDREGALHMRAVLAMKRNRFWYFDWDERPVLDAQFSRWPFIRMSPLWIQEGR